MQARICEAVFCADDQDPIQFDERQGILTGNVAAALFTHDTSRSLDPHLHTHCVVFNATFDPVEQRWKALQNYELLRARKFAENVYYHELARQLRSFGYQINNHPRGDFQIEGVSQEICDRFSKRDAEVDRALAKLHRAYAKRALMKLPSLEDYEKRSTLLC
jgi:conjugative relaxase-like TrwC/TraI family protein